MLCPPRPRDRLPRGQGREARVRARRVEALRRTASGSRPRTRSPRRSITATRSSADRRRRRLARQGPAHRSRGRVPRHDGRGRDGARRPTRDPHRLATTCGRCRGDRPRPRLPPAARETGAGRRVRRAAMLRDLFARDVELRVPLAQTFREEEDELIRLTSEQSRAARPARPDTRMRVTGCAGSGKTMLAVEQAKRLDRARRALGAVRLLQQRAAAAPLAERERDSGVAFWTVPQPLRPPRTPRRRSSCREYPLGEAPQSYFDDELPTRCRRDRRARAAVRRARRRRGPGPARRTG